MKKLLIIGLILALMGQVGGQNHAFNFYLSYQPADHGLGIRGDFDFRVKNIIIPLYGSISYGNLGVYRQYKIEHHTKFTIGLQTPPLEFNGMYIRWGAGLNYHWLGSIENTLIEPDNIILKPWSFEIIFFTVYMGNIAVGARIDILRWEPCVDFKYRFKFLKARRNTVLSKKYRKSCINN